MASVNKDTDVCTKAFQLRAFAYDNGLYVRKLEKKSLALNFLWYCLMIMKSDDNEF